MWYEQGTHNPKAAGSNPAPRTTFMKTIRYFFKVVISAPSLALALFIGFAFEAWANVGNRLPVQLYWVCTFSLFAFTAIALSLYIAGLCALHGSSGARKYLQYFGTAK
jgi:hypothetical protein